MVLILTVLQAFFDQVEVNPESISEVEILPEGSPGEWHIHVQPEQSWFAVVHYLTSQMREGPPRHPQRSAATFATRGKEAQFFKRQPPNFRQCYTPACHLAATGGKGSVKGDLKGSSIGL
jgi:hypothetical protein